MKEEKVHKFLSIAAIGSRKEIDKLIKEEKVKVNDNIIKLGDKCLPTDKIEVDNKQISFKLKEKIYIVLNKQENYSSTRADEYNRKTIFDLLNPLDNKPDLFSIARLDKETSGLIILTNDSGLTQRITHPDKNITFEYQFTLDKKLKSNHKLEIEEGIFLDDKKLDKCSINMIATSYTIKFFGEEKKRQLKKIFKNLGYEITKLKRIRIGNLNLNVLNLKEGEYKKVKLELIEKTVFN